MRWWTPIGPPVLGTGSAQLSRAADVPEADSGGQCKHHGNNLPPRADPQFDFCCSHNMTEPVPRRIVLKCSSRHAKVENEMIKAFFNSQNLDLEILEERDHYVHVLFEPRLSSRFVVLDLHCKTVPDIDLNKLPLQIFQVSKQRPLYVQLDSCQPELNKFKYIQRSRRERPHAGSTAISDYNLGLRQTYSSDELEGLLPLQIGQSPATFVSRASRASGKSLSCPLSGIHC